MSNSAYNVLVVDDELEVCNFIENDLKQLSFISKILICTNPIDAISYLQSEKFQLLITDLMMPEMSGKDLINLLYKDPSILKPDQVILYSGYIPLERSMGNFHTVKKPYQLAKFLEMVTGFSRQLSV